MRGALEPAAPAHSAQQPKPQPDISDELSRSDLWNFSAGAMGRGGGGVGGGVGGGGGGGGGESLGITHHHYGAASPSQGGDQLPPIHSPYNVQALGQLAPTSLSQEQSRLLYGASTMVPGAD